MKAHNIKMKEYLAHYGIKARVKLIESGSMRDTWRIYAPDTEYTPEIMAKLTEIGFTDFDNKPLHKLSSGGSVLSVFVRHPLTKSLTA